MNVTKNSEETSHSEKTANQKQKVTTQNASTTNRKNNNKNNKKRTRPQSTHRRIRNQLRTIQTNIRHNVDLPNNYSHSNSGDVKKDATCQERPTRTAL